MPTIEELHAADKEHAMSIAELRGRISAHDVAIERHEAHLAKLDETILTLREGLAGVATKSDINELRRDITDSNGRAMYQAHNSIPAKFAALFTAGIFILVGLALAIRLHGG